MGEAFKRLRSWLDEKAWAVIVLAVGSSAVFSNLNEMGHLLRGIRFRLNSQIDGLQSDSESFARISRELAVISEYPLQRALESCFSLIWTSWCLGMAAVLLIPFCRKLHLYARYALVAVLVYVLVVTPALRPVP